MQPAGQTPVAMAPTKPSRMGLGTRLLFRWCCALLPKQVVVSKKIGIVLVALGLLGLVWGGFTYTTREKIVDVGPIHATRDKTHHIPLAPVAGAVVLVGGIVLLVATKKA